MELATEGYRELTHLSLTVRLPITSDGHEDEDLLVWTTTPWTLSSNVAAAVHPDLTYVLVEGSDGRRWWLSHGSLPRVAPDAAVLREAKGAELVGLTYRGPFDELPAAEGIAHRVITWDEVSDEEGTGIVHIAPGCGQEDFALSKEFELAVIDPIDEFGRFREGFGWQSGRYAGADDPDGADLAREVADDLEPRACSSRASSTATRTRSAGAAAPRSSSGWSTSGSSPWTRCAPSCRTRPAGRHGCRRASGWRSGSSTGSETCPTG